MTEYEEVGPMIEEIHSACQSAFKKHNPYVDDAIKSILTCFLCFASEKIRQEAITMNEIIEMLEKAQVSIITRNINSKNTSDN